MHSQKSGTSENTEKETTNSTNLVENKSKGKHLFQKGHKKFGGKKKGQKNKATIEKEVIEQGFKNRILSEIQDLLTAQLNIAKGTSYLYKIVYHQPGTKSERKEHILVTDPIEIKDFLDELEGDTEGVLEDTYYYIATKQPDNRALDSLINRVFGKPKEIIEAELTHKIYTWKPYGQEQLKQPKENGDNNQKV